MLSGHMGGLVYSKALVNRCNMLSVQQHSHRVQYSIARNIKYQTLCQCCFIDELFRSVIVKQLQPKRVLYNHRFLCIQHHNLIFTEEKCKVCEVEFNVDQIFHKDLTKHCKFSEVTVLNTVLVECHQNMTAKQESNQ